MIPQSSDSLAQTVITMLNVQHEPVSLIKVSVGVQSAAQAMIIAQLAMSVALSGVVALVFLHSELKNGSVI